MRGRTADREPEARGDGRDTRPQGRERSGHRREYDARQPRRTFDERVEGVVRDVGAFRAVALKDLIERRFDGHPFAARRGLARAERARQALGRAAAGRRGPRAGGRGRQGARAGCACRVRRRGGPDRALQGRGRINALPGPGDPGEGAGVAMYASSPGAAATVRRALGGGSRGGGRPRREQEVIELCGRGRRAWG